MYLYSANGAIKKYRSPEDILSEFYDLRIDMYRRRKEYLIKKYENELNILAWKMKFIKFVLDGTIIVFKQKKEVIINKLKELKFPELATNKESDDKESYEYITSLPLFSLTDEKVEELQEKINNKEEEIVKIKATSEIDQWKKELELLLEKYEEWNEIKPKEIKIKAIKKTTKATKKNVLVI
jgi:DNA topoisomerase-2